MLRILIIDDNPGDRLLALRELRKTFPDLEAQEVGEASQLATVLESGTFELVILDYQLRWSNGLEVLQLLKARYPDCPVVMFTNSGSEEIAVRGMKQGLSDYVLKGQRLYRLTVAVEESLEKQRLRQQHELTMTQLRQSQEQLQQQAQELAEANRLKDEFLAVLSHELRTPLNPILGWIQLLRRGDVNPDKRDYALETIERNAKLLTQLIEDLLDISRILQGKLNLTQTPIDLVFVIESALETVRLLAEAKQIQIAIDLEPRGKFVLGDSDRLQQVVWNLLSNAIKFTPEAGSITVALNYVNREAQIVVKDTGKGIKPEFLPFVFDYFRQADSSTTRDFGGLGLGLAIARNLVELHNGKIQVESPGEGQGATFIVTLPLVSTTVAIRPATLPAEEFDLQGVKILAVDDDPDSLEFVSFVLTNVGATVKAVNSAAAALAVLSQFQPDLLISDVGMAEMNGYQLLQQINALAIPQTGWIPAIALTAYAGELNQQQAIAAGFQQHLTKPVDPNHLLAVVARLVHA